MNSWNAPPGELDFDDDYGISRQSQRVHIRNKCRTEGCENPAPLGYCDTCLERHERRMRTEFGFALQSQDDPRR